MTGAEALIEMLAARAGGTYFWIRRCDDLPGRGRLKAHPEIGYTLVRTEQNAGHAASGYARISGKLGCAW